MSEVLQLGIIIGYLFVALGVGIVAYRLTERTAEDYYLASRSFGTIVLLFTVFATLLSAFTFFGGPDGSYQHGPEWLLIMGLMDGIIFAILWYIIGYKQWLMGNQHGYITLGEMLGDQFKSTALRALVALVSLIWLFPYVMLQQIGAGGAIEALTDGTISFWFGATLITVFMILYVVLAGMRGIAWTDTLQGIFMLVVIWAAFLWILLTTQGIGAINDTLAMEHPEFLALGSEFYTPQQMLTLAISIAFGVAMFPQVNQRFFTAESEAVLKRSFSLWPILVLLLFVPAFLLGTWAQGLGVTADIGAGENVLPILLSEYTPVWFAALVVAGALAAMMSSSDAMLLSGSSYFTRDVYQPLVNPDLPEDKESFLGRIVVTVFAIAALGASLWVEAGGVAAGTIGAILLDIGDLAFGGFAQLAFPVLVAMYWQRTTDKGIISGIFVSQAVYISFNFVSATTIGIPVVGNVTIFASTYFGWGISLYCMLIGLVTTVVGSLLTTKTVENTMKNSVDEVASKQ